MISLPLFQSQSRSQCRRLCAHQLLLSQSSTHYQLAHRWLLSAHPQWVALVFVSRECCSICKLHQWKMCWGKFALKNRWRVMKTPHNNKKKAIQRNNFTRHWWQTETILSVRTDRSWPQTRKVRALLTPLKALAVAVTCSQGKFLMGQHWLVSLIHLQSQKLHLPKNKSRWRMQLRNLTRIYSSKSSLIIIFRLKTSLGRIHLRRNQQRRGQLSKD